MQSKACSTSQRGSDLPGNSKDGQGQRLQPGSALLFLLWALNFSSLPDSLVSTHTLRFLPPLSSGSRVSAGGSSQLRKDKPAVPCPGDFKASHFPRGSTIHCLNKSSGFWSEKLKNPSFACLFIGPTPYSSLKVKVAWSCLILCDPIDYKSMEFSRPEYWSGLPFPSPGDLPNPRIEPRSPTLQANSLPDTPQGKPLLLTRAL